MTGTAHDRLLAGDRRPPKLADVAALAGVSVSTASKALNGKDHVNARTRQRVLDAADKLSFRFNAIARGLQAGRTESVGIVTSDLEGRFVPQIMTGAENALGADRSSVLLSNSRGDPELEAHHVRSLVERRVDGLIIVGNIPAPRPPVAGRFGTPVVYAFAPSSDPNDYSVVADNVGAGVLATEHLLDNGRSAIFHLGGPAGSPAAQERAAGTRQALEAASIQSTPFQVVFGDWLEEWGWQGVSHLLESGAHFDGLVCGNDQIARGAIDRLIAAGKDVPGDVAVVGFDNWEVLSRLSRHPITSVDLDLQGIGFQSAHALLQGLAGRGGIRTQQGHVVVRASSQADA